jgi:hypothetical protein
MEIDRDTLLDSDKKPWTFQEEWVEDRFLSDVAALADRYHPKFLVLGIEVDFMALKKPEVFRGFVATYEKAYRIVKIKSPETKVSVSFQFEQIVNANGSTISITESPIIGSFGPLLDVLGLSIYPCQLFQNPDDITADYLSSVIPSGTKIAIFETGWPSSEGDENVQKEYVKWILQTTRTVSASLLVWISATDSGVSGDIRHDERAPPCKASVDTWQHQLGLWQLSGDPKKAVDTWREWLTKVPRITATSEAATTAQKLHEPTLRY